MEWFSQKTSIAGIQISNWILVVVAIPHPLPTMALQLRMAPAVSLAKGREAFGY